MAAPRAQSALPGCLVTSDSRGLAIFDWLQVYRARKMLSDGQVKRDQLVRFEAIQANSRQINVHNSNGRLGKRPARKQSPLCRVEYPVSSIQSNRPRRGGKRIRRARSANTVVLALLTRAEARSESYLNRKQLQMNKSNDAPIRFSG